MTTNINEIEHGLNGDLLEVNFDRIRSVFSEAGFETNRPQGAEIEVCNESIELDIYPRYPRGLREGSQSYLLSGVLDCPTTELDATIERIAMLFNAAGVIYNLEYDSERSGNIAVVTHPDFKLPDPIGLESCYIFEVGSAYAPDSPWGVSRLSIQPDGSFEFENQRGPNRSGRRTGRLSPLSMAGLAAELKEAAFPHVPKQKMLPGPRYLTISCGGQQAMVSLDAAPSFVGYAHITKWVLEWTTYLRTNPNLAEAPASILVVDPS